MTIKVILLLVYSVSRIVWSELMCFNGGINAFENCYFLFHSLQTNEDAETICLSINSRLLTVFNEAEQNFALGIAVERFTTSDYWLGLEKLDGQRSWRWNDGSTLFYSNWAEGYPSDKRNELCVAANLTNGKWYTVNCTEKRFPICKTMMIVDNCQSCLKGSGDLDGTLHNISVDDQLSSPNYFDNSNVPSSSLPDISADDRLISSSYFDDREASSQSSTSPVTPTEAVTLSCTPCEPCTVQTSPAPCASLSAVTTTPTETDDLRAKNWTYFWSTDAWYKVLNDHSSWMRWEHIANACLKEGGYLTSVHSDVENQFVYGLATGDHWCTHAAIGLRSSPSAVNVYQWVDFSTFDYANWRNNTDLPPSESNAYCGYMSNEKWGPWDLFDCGNTYGLCAVCKRISF
uniref:C-type lectin domain-containing protein n=1 Tax=Parascaris univalens TaxID=6257 RepID=A0A915AEZ1_PARUN